MVHRESVSPGYLRTSGEVHPRLRAGNPGDSFLGSAPSHVYVHWNGPIRLGVDPPREGQAERHDKGGGLTMSGLEIISIVALVAGGVVQWLSHVIQF